MLPVGILVEFHRRVHRPRGGWRGLGGGRRAHHRSGQRDGGQAMSEIQVHRFPRSRSGPSFRRCNQEIVKILCPRHDYKYFEKTTIIKRLFDIDYQYFQIDKITNGS
jgi:hypothetical protein